MRNESVRFNEELKYVLREIKQTRTPKSKLLRANHASYISKPYIFKKNIHSYLENLYFKKHTDHSLRSYDTIAARIILRTFS